MTQDRLIERLTTVLDPAQAAEVANDAARALVRPDGIAALVELLDELREHSAKLGRLAIETLPELNRRAGLADVVSWLDLGVSLAGSSGAAALKYFKDSPLVLGLIEPPAARGPVLEVSLELAEGDPNVALEFLRHTPELLTLLPVDALTGWAEIGSDLARWDYVLGIEYVRQCPVVARVLPFEHVRSWVTFGSKLVTKNSLGKPDYVGTLEFFRTSPAILGDIADMSVRVDVIAVGSLLADSDPAAGIAFLAAAPQLLARLPSEVWRLRVLRYAALVAERDATAALAYVHRCPDIVAMLGDSLLSEEKFGEWFSSGMEILGYSAEGARAYFALETQKALASVEKATSGVALRHMQRQLKLFAQALCGIDVTIQALAGTAVEETGKGTRATVTPDGRTILLPELVRRWTTKEENARFYTVMTAHEAGHLEFGTYRLSLDRLSDLVSAVAVRYGRSLPEDHRALDVPTLGDLFGLYPQPGLIRDFWTILEDARIEYRLQAEYPGLKRELMAAARDAADTRSLTHGLSVRELVADCLLLFTTQELGTFTVPEAIADIMENIYPLCRDVLTVTATAEATVRLADRVYVLLDQMLAGTTPHRSSGEPASDDGQGLGPKASETMSSEYRPVTNWTYRGDMQPEFIGDRGSESEIDGDVDGQSVEPGAEGVDETDYAAVHVRNEQADDGRGGGLGSGSDDNSSIGELAISRDALRQHPGKDRTSKREISYDEWDGRIQDYRSGWCRVVERDATEGSADFVEAALAAHQPLVRLLRRYFESLRPPGWRRVRGQQDGEEVDLDAVVSLVADRAAGAELPERIYVRREKRDRDVAAAFLVDLSGSTSRQIEGDGRRVIDVEKEGLVLLCEALGAIGDQYAIYGYSGRGRRDVDFAIIKDFEEAATGRVRERLGGMSPLQQNRDGAAIRHATTKLLRRSAKTRLLVLISDGRPLDDGYADEYALEDTKMALREARMLGIEPFCITVDREANDYLRRMYGEVRFLIIDRASALPERLPKVYQRLTA